jgi:hypothetical protein
MDGPSKIRGTGGRPASPPHRPWPNVLVVLTFYHRAQAEASGRVLDFGHRRNHARERDKATGSRELDAVEQQRCARQGMAHGLNAATVGTRSWPKAQLLTRPCTVNFQATSLPP